MLKKCEVDSKAALLSSMAPLKPLVDTYFSAWNAQDVNALRAVLADDCKLRDWEVSATGGDEVAAANAKIWAAVPKIAIVVLDVFTSETTATAEIIVKLNDEAGTELQVADIIGFNEAGKITFVRAYKC